MPFHGLRPAALVKSGVAPSCYIPFDSSHHEESKSLYSIQIGPLGAEIWAKPKLFGGSFHFSGIFDFPGFSSQWRVEILISYFVHMQLSMQNPNKQMNLDDSKIFSFYIFCHAKCWGFWLGRNGFSCYFQHFTRNRRKPRERGPNIFAKESPIHIAWTPDVPIKKWMNLFYYLLYGHHAFQGLQPAALVKSDAAPSCYIPFDSSHHKDSK